MPVGPPTFEQIAAANSAAATPTSGTRGRRLAIAGGVLGISAAALVGVAFVTGRDDVAGGADSPEAAITELAEALSAGDALAAVGYLAPDELSGADAFVEKLIPYVAELSDEFDGNESDDEDRAGLVGDGFELDVDVVDVEVDERGEYAAVVSFAIVGEATIDPSNLSMIGDQYFGEEGSDAETTTEFDSRIPSDDFDGDDIELVTVELDGKWYISPFLSAGHVWVESEGLPGGDFDLVGEERPGAATDPVAAVDRYFQIDSVQTADEAAEILGGGEGRFLHVFNDAIDSSEFFDASNMEGLDDAFGADFDYTLTELDDGRVEIDDIEMSFDDGFGDTVTMTVSDGCGSIETSGETVRGCFRELFPPGADVDDTLWFQTVEEDGGYRVVLLPTVFDMMSRFVGPYDADTMRWALDFAHEDDPQPAAVEEQIDIDFDGRRYVVYEFELNGDSVYTIDVAGGTGYDVFLSDGDDDRFHRWWGWGEQIETYEATTARVVVDSDVVTNCRAFECVPTGDGTTSLTVSETDRIADDSTLPEEWGEDDWVVEDGEEAAQEWPDPRLADALVWNMVEIDGPTVASVDLPAGVFDSWTSSWGSDVRVTIAGTDCGDASQDVNCSFDHTGGTVDVLFEPDPGASPFSVTFSARATYLDALTSVDASRVRLDGALDGEHRAAVFDDVPAGTILVVATGLDGQDLVLNIDGQPQCEEIDTGLSEGEACVIQHAGGPLSVQVGGWSSIDQVGEVDITLEVSS